MDPPSSLGYVALSMGPVYFYTNNDTGYTTISGPVGTRISLYDLNPNVDRSDTTYVRGLNLIASRTDKGVVTYYHYNAHGDVVQLTDSTGALVKNYEYDAFGVEENADEDDANLFRYCGEQFDAETGNYYLRARYYTPGVGRFTQEDPIRDGLNWYAYCAGNPVGFVDPSGLEYGWIRDFTEDLEMIFPSSEMEGAATYSFSGEENDRRVTVQVGAGAFKRVGTFYFDGRVAMPIHHGNNKKVFEGIADNVDGKLYMERTDFYKAMGINYCEGSIVFEVTDSEEKISNIILSGVAAYVTHGITNAVPAFFASTALTEGGTMFVKRAGSYRDDFIIAEAYSAGLQQYRVIVTTTEYKASGSFDKNGVATAGMNLVYGPYTQYYGDYNYSFIDVASTNAFGR